MLRVDFSNKRFGAHSKVSSTSPFLHLSRRIRSMNNHVLFFLLLILLLFVLKIIHLLPYNEALGPSIFPDLVKLKIRFHFVSLGLLRIWLGLPISFVFFIEFSVLSVETLVKVVQKGYCYEKTDERNECNQHFDDIVNSFSTLLLLIHVHTDIAQ